MLRHCHIYTTPHPEVPQGAGCTIREPAPDVVQKSMADDKYYVFHITKNIISEILYDMAQIFLLFFSKIG